MQPPQDDLAARTPVWDALQMIFMDTDPGIFLPSMAEVCARSPYTLAEIEAILFHEVLPACRFNLFAGPAPEWAGFATEWLVQRILRKHRFGRRRPLLLRRYTLGYWQKLAPLIEARRAGPEARAR
jgi:hypothetical protein